MQHLQRLNFKKVYLGFLGIKTKRPVSLYGPYFLTIKTNIMNANKKRKSILSITTEYDEKTDVADVHVTIEGTSVDLAHGLAVVLTDDPSFLNVVQEAIRIYSNKLLIKMEQN